MAADAVVDDEPTKETLTYPMLEREDKFPVYYPTVETKETVYPNRREDTYHPTQYPVFITDKMAHEYPSIAQDDDLISTGYSNLPSGLDTALNEYTVSASLSNHIKEAKKAVTQVPLTSTTFKVETPTINLFSPPIETEGKMHFTFFLINFLNIFMNQMTASIILFYSVYFNFRRFYTKGSRNHRRVLRCVPEYPSGHTYSSSNNINAT